MQFERFRFYSIPVLHDSVFKTLVLPNMKAPRKGVEEIYKKNSQWNCNVGNITANFKENILCKQ